MLTPGDQIGDWEVVLPLGQGGMGSVFRCRHALSHRIEAAVKVLKPTDVSGARERFIREAEALHALSHPAIVRVHGFGQDASTQLLWLAMELVQGQNFEFLLQDGLFPRGRAAEIFATVADGLAYAHSRGIVHRDIKPANLMLRADGRPVLLDFGIAVQEGHDRLTQEGVVPGTVAYSAPEQVTFGKDNDPALADIYALGQVFCECATGDFTFPRDGDHSEQRRAVRILKRKLRMGPLDPGDEVAPATRRLILDATQPDPARRGPPFSSWRAILEGGAAPVPTDRTGLRAAEPPDGGGPERAGLFADDDVDLDSSAVERLRPGMAADLALPELDLPPDEATTSVHDAETDVHVRSRSSVLWILLGVALSVVVVGLVGLVLVGVAGGAAWWTLAPTPTQPVDARPLRDVLHPETVVPHATDEPVVPAPAPELVVEPVTRPTTRVFAQPPKPPAGPPGGDMAKLVIGADRTAVIFLDGERLRTTPFTRRLPPGAYGVRLEAAGGRSKDFEVQLDAGETVRRIWDFSDSEWRSFDGGIDESSLPPRPKLSGIERKIRAMPEVISCMEGQSDAVSLRFVVVPDGSIVADAVEPGWHAGSELETCLFKAVRTLRLEPSRAGAVVLVKLGAS